MRNVGILTTLLALALGGCIMPQETPNEIVQALPRADDISIKVPEQQTFAVGDVAEYYRLTRDVSRSLNGGAAWVLVLLHTVIHFPPTSVDGDVYTWGPHSDALDPAEWRLTVTENSDGTYDWAFDARSKLELGTSFETIISGHAVPGDVPHRGSGSFLIDFDASERVNPLENDEKGYAEFVYDLDTRNGTSGSLDIHLQTREDDGNGGERDVYFDYSYAENADGSGDLQFALHADLDDSGSAIEDALIRSRWTYEGAGRADVMASGGDLGDITVSLSECWDSTFRRVYYEDVNEWAPTEGDASDCAFADQDLPDSL